MLRVIISCLQDRIVMLAIIVVVLFEEECIHFCYSTIISSTHRILATISLN